MIADLPDWADVQFLRDTSGFLVVGGILLAVVLFFALRSIARKLFTLVVIGACVFGLMHYRQTLEHCNDTGCACKLFGETVRGGKNCVEPTAESTVNKEP